jgi:hypothetical protein
MFGDTTRNVPFVYNYHTGFYTNGGVTSQLQAFPPPYRDPATYAPLLSTSGLDLSQFNVVAQNSEGWFLIEDTRTQVVNPIGNGTVQDLFLVAPALPEPASFALLLSGAGTVLGYWKWKKHDGQRGG